jgi:hypothetical protein
MPDFGIRTQTEMQSIGKIDKTEHGLQEMVAISPAAGYMQKQVKLGWCRTSQVRQHFSHGTNFH